MDCLSMCGKYQHMMDEYSIQTTNGETYGVLKWPLISTESRPILVPLTWSHKSSFQVPVSMELLNQVENAFYWLIKDELHVKLLNPLHVLRELPLKTLAVNAHIREVLGLNMNFTPTLSFLFFCFECKCSTLALGTDVSHRSLALVHIFFRVIDVATFFPFSLGTGHNHLLWFIQAYVAYHFPVKYTNNKKH